MVIPTLFRFEGWVKTPLGPAVAGAQIFVCSQPVNTLFPPTPQVQLFSDPAGQVPLSQPVYTDGFGHYAFYLAPTVSTLVVAISGLIQQVYPDQEAGLSGASS